MRNFLPFFVLTVCVLFFQTISAQENKQVRTIRGGIMCGKVTSLPKPPYPEEAKKAKVSGAVQVKVIVGIDGRVETAEAVSGHELLHKAAEQAALAAKFSPTKIAGEAVRVSGVIVYNFVK